MNLLEYIKNPVTGNDLLNAVVSSVNDKEKELVDLQKKQWAEGKNREGEVIGRYKPFTERKSKEQPFPNKPKVAGQPYNLDWSGDLKRKTFAKGKKSNKDVTVVIDSKGVALDKLFETIKKYGLISDPNTIFGYQQKNKDAFTKLINRTALKKLKNRIK